MPSKKIRTLPAAASRNAPKMSRRVHATMYGRRRPNLLVLRSDAMPNKGGMTNETIDPTVEIQPSNTACWTLHVWPGGRKSKICSGLAIGKRAAESALVDGDARLR